MANGIYKITEDFERELCDKFNWKKNEDNTNYRRIYK